MIAPKKIPTRSKKAGAHFGPVCQCVPAPSGHGCHAKRGDHIARFVRLLFGRWDSLAGSLGASGCRSQRSAPGTAHRGFRVGPDRPLCNRRTPPPVCRDAGYGLGDGRLVRLSPWGEAGAAVCISLFLESLSTAPGEGVNIARLRTPTPSPRPSPQGERGKERHEHLC